MDNSPKQTIGQRILSAVGLGSVSKAGDHMGRNPSRIDAAVDAAVEGRSPAARINAVTDRYTRGGGAQPAVQQEQETQAEAPKPFRF